MSHFEDEEEDELQMILEGRDVQQYREYITYQREDHSRSQSEHSKSDSDQSIDEDNDTQNRSVQSKKQKLDHNIDQRKYKRKPKISSVDLLNEDKQNEVVTEDLNSIDINVNNDEMGDEKEVKIKMKVRRTLKPQPKLNADRLMANEGLALLPQIFSDFKFGEKGSELKDLNAIMFRLSHWSHRLFPSLTFDDFIEKCEQLGNKRAVKTFVGKIRNDLPLNLFPNQSPHEDENNEQNDDFDNDKDFDYIIANSFGNFNDNNEKKQHFETNNSDSHHLNHIHIEQQLQDLNQKSETTLQPNTMNEQNDQNIDDSSDEEMTEQQILRAINSEDEPIE